MLTTVHVENYVTFLQRGYRQWVAARLPGNASSISTTLMSNLRKTAMGYAATTPRTALFPLRKAIESASFVLIAKLISRDDSSAFALCRPPGHHADRALPAGYCFLNNAALAAERFLQDGAAKVAILDFDYHYGNDTSTTAPMSFSFRSMPIPPSAIPISKATPKKWFRRRWGLM